ncbi:hypothetical protein ACEN8I_01850 [Polaromonas sp. CT11-55]|uniref:hypothetical protein n=1 Tax=Polaromonas sp. CT11-55 TaxID=3243045 RepID=UPI0039A68361
MKPVIELDISAAQLRATLRPAVAGWGSRVLRRLQRQRKPLEPTPAAALTETAGWAPGATRAETLAALFEAGAQALQALRARHPTSLDGCRLVVRTGVSASYVGVAPMDLSSPSARSEQQLRAVAKAVTQEAMGAEAAAHDVRWRMEASQAHLCVITLESALVAGLQALAQAQRMALASCQPAIVERLDSELKASRRRRDARTLVWTELDPSGHRHAALSFIRLVDGSAVNAWRTVTQAPSADSDPWLQPALQRFLIASGAGLEEQVVPCAWPAHTTQTPVPAAPGELAA